MKHLSNFIPLRKDGKYSSSFKTLIQEFLKISSIEFDTFSEDFKKFVNSCLLYLVENKHCSPLHLRRFLDWYFSDIVHDFDFIKHEWGKWKKEMDTSFDDQIKVYINEALIQACKLEKHEMVFVFVNNGFQIYDKDFKSCECSEECCELFHIF